MSIQDLKAEGMEQLKISQNVRNDLQRFIEQIIELCKEDLISITVFGSAVSGDYSEKTSDLNLLVIHSDLDIADLRNVAKLAQRWHQKRNFSPRFLSKRNLISASRYFQIDLMGMKDAHVVLCGEDILAQIAISPTDMRRQLAYEIKGMRMRIKQQFWRAAGNKRMMRIILLKRFASLTHLLRALLVLQNKPTSLSHQAIMEKAIRELKIDQQFVQWIGELKKGRKVGSQELESAFDKLLDLIRVVDNHVDQLAV